jgi:peptidoglycan/LPS O-acetylase OafA/YrhL
MANLDSSQRIYFKNLDILRFIAAYLVVLLHMFFGWKTHFGTMPLMSASASQASITRVETVMGNFSFGVDIFFVISGFLLTYLLISEFEKTGKVDVIKFYIRRAFRIWPLYFLLLLLGPILTYFFNEQSPGYLYHFLFAGNFDIMRSGPKSIATDHLWSICIEEHFYLICPLLIAYIPMKRLPEVLLFIVFISLLFRGYTAAFNPNLGNTIYVHTLSRIDVLALGSLFGYLYYKKAVVFNHSLAIRLMIYATFIFIFINVSYNEATNFFYATIKKYFFVFAASYWMGNFLFHKKALLSVKKTNIFHTFGKVTYGIYMFNPVIIYLILRFFSKFSFSNFFLYVLAVHAILAFVCYLSYRFFELPFLALKEKYAVVKSGGVVSSGAETISEQEPVAEPAIETVPLNVTETK